MRKLRKAVIPAAGLGTRFLPATKSIPKEMLPLVDAPTLLYIVEEIIDAGIEDIIFIAGRGKTAIEDFFDTSYELEATLARQNKLGYLERLDRVRNRANFISIRQREAKGLGHAVLTSQSIVGDEPFAVLLGDEIMIGTPGVTRQLSIGFEETGFSTVAVMNVPRKDVKKYGIVAADSLGDGLYQVRDVVEKPSVEDTPSTLALPGRYIFEPRVYQHLKNTKPGVNGEIQLTDAMTELAREGRLLASTFHARRYDAGDKLGFLQANVEIALEHPELATDFKNYLKDLVKSWD